MKSGFYILVIVELCVLLVYIRIPACEIAASR